MKSFKQAASGLLLLVVAIMTTSLGSVGAVGKPAPYYRFIDTGVETSYSSNITDPPQVGQTSTATERLIDRHGTDVGTDTIDCRVTAVTGTVGQLICRYVFTFSDASLTAEANFAVGQTRYNARIVSASGNYFRAVGNVHVTPSTKTYDFDFYAS